MKIIGHRGAKGLAPENTIASLQKAIDHGVDAVEFDLRVTRDDIIVLHHNPKVEDRQGNLLTISTNTYKDLKAHKADLPTFEEVVRAISSQSMMIAEIKPGVPTKPIIRSISTLLKQELLPSNTLLASRSYAILKELHKELPKMELMVIDRWSGVRATFRARHLGTKKLVMNQSWLWSGFIRSVSKGGYELYAYPLNNPFKASRWAKHGLAGVITDYPDRYKFIRE